MGPQLAKEGSGATKKWYEDIKKKLHQLDENSKRFLKDNRQRPLSVAMRRSVSLENVTTQLEEADVSASNKRILIEKNIKEIAKIFHINKKLDMLGAVGLKFVLSQKAAVNEKSVRGIIQELGNESSLRALIATNSKK